MTGKKGCCIFVTLLICAVYGGKLPAATTTDDAIRTYQLLLLHRPADYTIHTKLGSLYVQKARETGEIAYYELAEQTLRKSLELKSDGNYQAHTYLAVIFQVKHQFRKAVAYAERAIKMAPADSYAYGILGDAYRDQGEYAQAAGAYDTMLRLEPSLFSYSRLSLLQWLRGDTDGAVQSMRQALQLGIKRSRPKEYIAWIQLQLGDFHFNMGDLGKAEEQYAASLNTYPGYHPSTFGLANVRVAQGRYPEAITLYEKALGIIELPHYAASLGDLYRKLGRTEAAQQQYDLVGEIGQLNPINQVVYNRALAYFYADHDMNVQGALERARRELQTRKDIYTYDVLAWALLKNGHPHEALVAMTEALKLGTKEARLLFHAGMIHHHLGETENAEAYLTCALATNPYFDLFQAEVAQATLREIEQQASGSPST
ncbi:MAG: tetratricopeptide repeat protein [Nitrospirales bacterium]